MSGTKNDIAGGEELKMPSLKDEFLSEESERKKFLIEKKMMAAKPIKLT